jgi:hypothetical protein
MNANTQKDDLKEAFESACIEAINKPNLTLRQMLWIAFNAGGQYAIKTIGESHGAEPSAPKVQP